VPRPLGEAGRGGTSSFSFAVSCPLFNAANSFSLSVVRLPPTFVSTLPRLMRISPPFV